jgi:hypothetical protein
MSMESDVTLLTGIAVDEQALVVLKKKGSQGVIVGLHLACPQRGHA